MFKKFLLFLIFVVFCLVVAGASGLYWLVVVEPGKEILPENIHNILGRESHVFYNDGTTKLGVFFDNAHRQYVTYSEIPADFVNALVASEDDKFFDHFGFDVVGIIRAMIKNIEAGRIVQGGSTLTQQTVKNLFKRSGRSIEAKLKELLFALRLEYYYPKEKIFEFYANQFYVSGNGHGLGVAARYYFDKKPSELTLVECAFIAGSVKRPNYYNPFIKKTKEGAEIARLRARVRLKYVLKKMWNLGMIDDFVYKKALAEEIGFKNGRVGYSLDYAMEMVRDAVSSDEVLAALQSHDVTNIATSGIRIITTIDRKLQGKTLAILRDELSRLDVRLRGFEREEIQKELFSCDYGGDSILAEDAFLFGTVERIEGRGKDVRIIVTLDKKLGQGVIKARGLQTIVSARVKWQRNRWSKVKKSDLGKLIAAIHVGDRVWVRVRSLADGSLVELDLEKYPKLQGGALVLKNGAIIGMAGGTENRFFNRAIQAKRTMGSAFKPIVYCAALQLGWNSTDLLENSRDIFVYHGQPYYPRPDHHSPHKWVSMSWAGVHSENVASVWLLSHLCDHLSVDQFREVAAHLDLAPRMVDGKKEPYGTYQARIRDKYGILINRGVLHEASFRAAVKNLETDFLFDGMEAEYKMLKDLHYGRNFNSFMKKIKEEMKRGGKKKLSKKERKERIFRKSLLKDNYLLLRPLYVKLQQLAARVEESIERDNIAFMIDDPFEQVKDPVALFVDNVTGRFSLYFLGDEPPSSQRVNSDDLRDYLYDLDDIDRQLFWEKVRLNGSLSKIAFDRVEEQIAYEYRKIIKKRPYGFDVLAQVEDFRITVGLHYLVKFGKSLGIQSKLEPVLSFPLGSNVVSLLETTRMYEAMVTGSVTRFGNGADRGSNDSLAIIDRIESADGKVLYRPTPVRTAVVGRETSLATGHILENVIKFGTGRMAGKRVRLNKDRIGANIELGDVDTDIPLLGKTGTANRYTNGSFFGYLPGIIDNSSTLTLQDGYAVGVYVGFDNNEEMRRKSSRISGSAGALPAWCSIVNVLLDEEEFASRLDPVDLSFYGLVIKRDAEFMLNVGVSPELGGQVLEPVKVVSGSARRQPSILTFGSRDQEGNFQPKRYFQPFWKSAAEKE